MEKISAVYKIVNTVTGDFYVGSSKNVKKRWASHKCPSKWKKHPNSPLYLDMQKYGLDKFRFQILAPVMEEYLTQVEQEFIDLLNPTYNNLNAKGLNVERHKEYEHSEKRKEAHRKAHRKYKHSEKGKESARKSSRKYRHQLCSYNGEELTFCALINRFRRARIKNPTTEAKKYLINGTSSNQDSDVFLSILV